MASSVFKYVYGPVASRRLSRSLGLDLVPFKICTYNCRLHALVKTGDVSVLRKEDGLFYQVRSMPADQSLR